MATEMLKQIAEELNQCRACTFRQQAIAPVGWFGSEASPLILVGEGPGLVEDEYGLPLIGPSGQLLDKALWAAKMTRDKVLTTNIIKCRPHNNKTPNLAEADFCARLWLERELREIRPAVVVALGSVALHYLCGADKKISRDRGLWFKAAAGYDCIATYHPAYLLRLTGPSLVKAKWDVFHDLETARDRALSLRPGYEFSSAAPADLRSLTQKRVRRQR